MTLPQISGWQSCVLFLVLLLPGQSKGQPSPSHLTDQSCPFLTRCRWDPQSTDPITVSDFVRAREEWYQIPDDDTRGQAPAREWLRARISALGERFAQIQAIRTQVADRRTRNALDRCLSVVADGAAAMQANDSCDVVFRAASQGGPPALREIQRLLRQMGRLSHLSYFLAPRFFAVNEVDAQIAAKVRSIQQSGALRTPPSFSAERSRPRRSSSDRARARAMRPQVAPETLSTVTGSCRTESGSDPAGCSLGVLREEQGTTPLTLAGVHQGCLRRYSCQLAQYQANEGVVTPFLNALSPNLLAHEAIVFSALQRRRSSLRLKLIEKTVQQWITFAAQNCQNDWRSQLETRLAHCRERNHDDAFFVGEFDPLRGRLFEEGEQNQEEVCRRTRSHERERLIHQQGNELRATLCRRLWFESPYPSEQAARAAEAARTRDASLRQGGGGTVSAVSRFRDFQTAYESRCGHSTPLAASDLALQRGSTEAELGCLREILNPQLVSLVSTTDRAQIEESIDRLKNRGEIRLDDGNALRPFQVTEESRTARVALQNEDEHSRLLGETLRVACEPGESGLNLDELEITVGSQVDRSPELSQIGANRYADMLACTGRAASSSGFKETWQSLARTCQGMLELLSAAAPFAGPEAAAAVTLPFNALCILPQGVHAYHSESRYRRIQGLRAATRGGLGCNTAVELERLLSDAGATSDEAGTVLVQQALSLGVDVAGIFGAERNLATAYRRVEGEVRARGLAPRVQAELIAGADAAGNRVPSFGEQVQSVRARILPEFGPNDATHVLYNRWVEDLDETLNSAAMRPDLELATHRLSQLPGEEAVRAQLRLREALGSCAREAGGGGLRP